MIARDIFKYRPICGTIRRILRNKTQREKLLKFYKLIVLAGLVIRARGVSLSKMICHCPSLLKCDCSMIVHDLTGCEMKTSVTRYTLQQFINACLLVKGSRNSMSIERIASRYLRWQKCISHLEE